MSQVETGSGVITLYYNDFCFHDWLEICKAFGVYPHHTKSLQIHARDVIKHGDALLDGETEVLSFDKEVQQKYLDAHNKDQEEG